MNQCKKLFKPISLGSIEVKNRLVMLAVSNHYGDNDRVSRRLINFYSERARGGVGLIFIGILYPSNLGQPEHGDIGIYRDEFIPNLRELTDAVHAYGAKVAAQVALRYQWRPTENAPLEYVAPSEVVTGPGIHPPRALTVSEIHQIVQEYGEATRRAREAGFDAVDFSCAGGYLVSRFLSPCSNKRTDEYGGSLENRMRFLLEIINCGREKAGKDYTIVCRLGLEDFMDGGITIENSKMIAGILEKAGINGLVMYVGWHECPVPTTQSCVQPGGFVHLAEQVKNVVHIPVVATNRINHPLLAEKFLAEGKADMIGMARALIADPELPNKARSGHFDDIRPCIACNHCLDLVMQDTPLACTVNPRAGREIEYQIKRTSNAKKVFIAGGGPAGMEAAAVLAQRGHQVTLWECTNRLGGNLIPARVPPYKEEVGSFVDYLVTQVKKQGAQIKLGNELNLSYIKEYQPDVVIAATGASPIIPDIPGVKGRNVITATEVLLKSANNIGKKIVVIGGGMVGCETAEFLAGINREVTVLEMLDHIGQDIGPTTRWVILKRLRKAGVRMETGVHVIKITSHGVEAIRQGKTEFFPGDTIVLAVGLKPNNTLADNMKGKKIEFYAIGDCTKPAKIAQAIDDAIHIGTTI